LNSTSSAPVAGPYSQPERIAYLCGEYPRATDVFIQREVRALREAGLQVRTISVRRPQAGERPLDPDNEEAHRTTYLLPTGPLRLLAAHGRALLADPGRYFRAILLALKVRAPGLRALLYQLFYFSEAGLVADIMRREHLVHLHNHAPDSSGFVAMIAAEMGGFTFSMTLHGHGILSEPGRWRLREKLERALFTICVSWHARSQAMLWSPRQTWSKFHVVHCGVDLTEHRPPRGNPPGCRLVFVGRLDHVKGLPILLDAVGGLAARHPDIHLDIIGDGPERADLQALAIKAGLTDRVSFHGYLGQPEIRGLLAKADMFVMTSLVEGIPVVLMEAMAAGVPVVAPRITGIPELVEHGRSGLLYTPGNMADLMASITTLLNDRPFARRLSDHSLEAVARDFDLDMETRRLAAVMRCYIAHLPVETRPDPVG
jgi:glycosyltransferase involved in cell wall biosynthesis